MRMSQGFTKFADALRKLKGSWVALFVAIPLILVSRLIHATGADPDLFHRVATGRLIQLRGEVPTTDPFAFTPKLAQWIDHEWLSGVVFFWIAQNWGDSGLLAFRTGMFIATCLVIARAITLYSPEAVGRVAWPLVCLLHASFAWASVVRCQVFTYLFIPVLYLAFIEYFQLNRVRLLLLLPPVFAVWCNLHGGFVLGLIVLSCFTFFVAVRRRNTTLPLAVLVTSIAATACNPYGFIAYWRYLVEALSMSRPSISEWAPLHTQLKDFIPTVLILLPVAYGAIRKGRKNDLFACLLLLLSLYSGFRHSRLLAFSSVTLAIFGLPLLSECFTAVSRRSPARALRLDRTWSFAVALLTLLSMASITSSLLNRNISKLDTAEYPVSAVEWLRNSNQEGRLLVDFNNGAFALWRLFPRFQISMDSRYETVYPESTNVANSAALDFASGNNLDALAALNPSHILVPNSPYLCGREADSKKSWRLIYEDPQFCVLSRRLEDTAPQTEVHNEIVTGRPDLWLPLF
jgi:hypothetical protein